MVAQDGILEGVLKRTITAAQFCVCPNKTNRANIIESYTFHFHYQDTAGPSDFPLTDLASSRAGHSSVAIADAWDSVQELMNIIVPYTKQMPDLPGKSSIPAIIHTAGLTASFADTRFLTCHLFHLPDFSCDFHPFGFETSIDDTMSIPHTNDWRPKSVGINFLNFGCYR